MGAQSEFDSTSLQSAPSIWSEEKLSFDAAIKLNRNSFENLMKHPPGFGSCIPSSAEKSRRTNEVVAVVGGLKVHGRTSSYKQAEKLN
jgi:hypothetical protein